MTSNTELLRSLSKEAAALKMSDTDGDVLSSKKKNKVSFELTLSEYPDFIVTRTTPKTVKHLVVMPSAGAVFIKTTSRKGEPVSEVLTPESYAEFTSGMPDIVLPDGFWARRLVRGKEKGEMLISVLRDSILLEMIRKKALSEDTDLLLDKMWGEYASNVKFYNAFQVYPQLVLEYKDSGKAARLIDESIEFMKSLIEKFGLQNTRDFLDSYNESLVDLSTSISLYRNSVTTSRTHLSELPDYKMNFNSFKNYFLFDSYRMGYGGRMQTFMNEWKDALDMEIQLYGKVREKYPEALPMYHNQLSFKVAQMKEVIDEKAFEAQVKRAERYEGVYKGYKFIAPKCRQDFLDEASMQCNCLAGYIGKFTDGECLILFMRKKDDPDKSYITIEIRNGNAVQAKLARNYAVSQSDLLIIDSWVRRCNDRMSGGDEDIHGGQAPE